MSEIIRINRSFVKTSAVEEISVTFDHSVVRSLYILWRQSWR